MLLGAGSEAGPLAWLAQWRANIVAIDLARGPAWKKIAQRVRAGNGQLIAPVAASARWAATPRRTVALAGCDMLTQTPEIAAWLRQLGAAAGPVLHRLPRRRKACARVAGHGCHRPWPACGAEPRCTLAWMATPTDVFAVPQPLADAVMRAYDDRGTLKRLAQAGLRAGSGGRSFAPHIEALVEADDGSRWGVVDCLVIEQGPNYALAKRLQQWRAIVARADGQVASINVAPSTTTASVLSNPALAAGFRGAKAFDIEVFEPDTTNALMAALWVHDLRNPQAPGPSVGAAGAPAAAAERRRQPRRPVARALPAALGAALCGAAGPDEAALRRGDRSRARPACRAKARAGFRPPREGPTARGPRPRPPRCRRRRPT